MDDSTGSRPRVGMKADTGDAAPDFEVFDELEGKEIDFRL